MTGEGRPARVLGLIEELAEDGVRAIGPDTRLADAGLDSLAFAELATVLERETGVDLASADVGPDDRISDVLRAVEAARSPSGATVLPAELGRL